MELFDAITIKKPFMQQGDFFVQTNIDSTYNESEFCNEIKDLKHEFDTVRQIWDKDVSKYTMPSHYRMIYVSSILTTSRTTDIPRVHHIFWQANERILLVSDNNPLFKIFRDKNNDGTEKPDGCIELKERPRRQYNNGETLLEMTHNSITAIANCESGKDYSLTIENKLASDGSFIEQVTFETNGNPQLTRRQVIFLNEIATNFIYSNKCIITNTGERYELLTV